MERGYKDSQGQTAHILERLNKPKAELVLADEDWHHSDLIWPTAICR